MLGGCSTDGKTKCLNTFSGYVCGCGGCYTEEVNKQGQVSCKAKCDLKKCDEATGTCPASSGLSGVPLAFSCLLV